ncbi:EpsG family protein [Chryseobacterium lineare]
MAVWQKENNEDKVIKIILFLVSPILAFLFSLRTLKTKSSFIIIFLFSVFFGLSFSVDKGKNSNDSIDGSTYREKFEHYRFVTDSKFYKDLIEYFTFEKGKQDYYFDTVAFYVSRFTSNYHIMFMVFAIVFTFFALKSLKFFIAEKNYSTSLACFILLYLFMINQIFNINGVRFWTAGWIGVYSIFQIFRNGKYQYFLLLLCAPFFHGAFWVFLGVSVIAYFGKNFYKLWTILFFVSFLVSNISLDLVRNYIDLFPTFIVKMAESYTDESYIQGKASGGTGFYWIAATFDFLTRVYMNFLVYLFIKNSKEIIDNAKTKYLFSFLLVLMVFVNFTMAIPSLGGRYMLLSYPIIAYIWLVNFKGRKYNKVVYAMPVIFSFSFYVQAVLYMKVLEPVFYFSNPIYLLYLYL